MSSESGQERLQKVDVLKAGNVFAAPSMPAAGMDAAAPCARPGQIPVKKIIATKNQNRGQCMMAVR